VAERLKQDGVPEEKIHRIYNGLDPDEWNVHERSQVRESLGVGQDTFIFGCVGQLVPWKNHAAFIEAANLLVQEGKCRNARFVIMGGDLWGEHDSYIKELRALVKKYNLQERFNFIPHQPDSVDAISGMDAVVLCSHDEPFGRVLIEAMALEKPVIAYAENGPGEIVTHEHDGLLVPPDEENGMYIAMERILSDADLRRQLSGQARHSVIEKFHIADSGQRVLELYRDIVQ
jgi:glycosyltransferase involved in cell wall biosynthesis